MDPRQWISMGTIDEDSEDARSIRFNDDDGAPLPTGPLVTVTLQPSGITVTCRVASFIAGVGESAWFPFQQKDEVIVAIPQGSERAGPVILGRLNQALDTFPAVVAGQDTSKNTFDFGDFEPRSLSNRRSPFSSVRRRPVRRLASIRPVKSS